MYAGWASGLRRKLSSVTVCPSQLVAEELIMYALSLVSAANVGAADSAVMHRVTTRGLFVHMERLSCSRNLLYRAELQHDLVVVGHTSCCGSVDGKPSTCTRSLQ